MSRMDGCADRLICAYLSAREHIVACGFGHEIDRQDLASPARLSESSFLREAAWVVLSAGLSERAVRACFPGVSDSFCSWSSAAAIVERRGACVRRALRVFRHEPKIQAIAAIAGVVDHLGFQVVRYEIDATGVAFLESLAFIGPVTRYHLAKNIGLDVVKPDRHLVRIAEAAGFPDPGALCKVIAERTGDRLATIDLVLWRYATLVPAYLSLFAEESADLIAARPPARI